jgi:ribosomal protein L11 methyltransferase
MFELKLMCPESRVEIVSDALDALDALSVSVEDADAQTDAEQALFGEPGMPPPKEGWQRSRMIALFPTEASAKEALSLLTVQDFFAECEVLGVHELAEQDWVRLTQSQFTPVDITPTFWIVPTWHEPPAEARIVIRLDPGLAFGTGTHPTTRMCLRWLARQGEAVDIDDAAVESTVLNAQANNVTLKAGLPDAASGQYQTVLANILATPLKVLAPLLWSRVAPGGALVLSGILEQQAEELKLAYAPYCKLTVSDQEDGWILMTSTA